MATLSGNKIKDTYQSLVKFSDNGNITTSAKQLTDGFGNNSPMYVSTTQVGIGVTPESGLNLHVYGDAKIGSNLTVIGNLVVEGSTTTVGTDTLTVKDPLIVLANNNTSTDAVDIGFYGKYTPSGTTLYSGLFREALTGKYRLFKDLQEEPTTTVNTSGTGYAVATLIANLEGNVTGNLIGSVTGGTFSGTLLSNVAATTQSAGDNSTKVATTAYVDNQVGLYDTLSEVLANGNTSGANDIIMEDSQKVNYGTGSDLQIYHDATDSYIKNDTGNLIIEQTTDDADIIFKNDNGSGDTIEYFRIDGSESRIVYGRSIHMADNVSIFLGNDDDGLIRYDSTANKILYTGTSQFSNDLTVVGDAVFNGNINLDDDERIRLGTSNAFQLYYDSTLESGQGGAVIDSNRIFIETSFFQLNSRTGENMIKATSNGNVELYYDNSKKLETTSTGVSITGNINLGDNNKIILGVGDDLEIYSDGTDNYITQSSGTDLIFTIDSTEMMRIQSGGDISISESNPGNASRFYVKGFGYSTNAWAVGTSTGTFVGQITSSASKLQIKSEENNDIQIGDATSLNIIHIDTSEDSVGINLTNPADYTADELVISVPDGSGMTLVSGSTDAAYIEFKDSTGAIGVNGGFISYNHDTDTLTNFAQSKVSIAILEAEVAYFTDTAFYVDKSTTIDDTLTVNGNVGINETSPASSRFTNSSSRILDISGNAVNRGGVITLRTSDNSKEAFLANDAGLLQIGTYTNNDVTLYTNNIERMRIDSSGNVLIGSTSFNTGGLSGTAKGLNVSSVTPIVLLHESDTDKDGYIGIAGSTMFIQTADAIPMRFGTNDTERMRIDSSGIVRIFTTGGTSEKTYSAAAGLELYSQQSDASVPYTKTSDIVANGDGTVPSELRMFTKASGSSTPTERMRIDSSGNVGIGTDSPDRILHINSSNVQIAALIESTNTTSTQLNFKNGSTTNNGGFIKTTGDNIILTANNTSATHLVVASGGNVGIGTTSPAALLDVAGNIYGVRLYVNSGGNATDPMIRVKTDTNTGIFFPADDTLAITTGGTERMRITGGTGAGESSTMINYTNSNIETYGSGAYSGKLIVKAHTTTPNAAITCLNGNVGGDNPVFINFINEFVSNQYNYLARIAAAPENTWTGTASTRNASLNFYTNYAGTSAERMRITSGGDFCVGTTTGRPDSAADAGVAIAPAGKFFIYSTSDFGVYNTNTTGKKIYFRINNSEKGSIQFNTNSVAYNTTSDYRLKENVVEMTGALDRVSQLKPSRFNFIGDVNVIVDGFLAHEVQEIVPEAISGKKDAVDEEGNPEYQGIDQSKLVPLLVGAIQELQKRIEILENK